MPGTALDHPLVRDYLRELDAALAVLPARRAGELREQIITHLWDVLADDASDEEAAVALLSLGSPRELAAEAGAGAEEAAARAAAARAAGRHGRVRATLGRLSWRARVILAVTIIVAGSVTGYTVAALTASPLQADGQTGWWYPQDYKSAVETQADQSTQSTVRLRPSARQGFFVDVYNPSDWSQIVTGLDAHWQLNAYGSFGQLSVATTGRPGDDGTGLRTNRYRLPEVIPPHQWRTVRLMWANSSCAGAGGTSIFDQLVLTVRVGGFDRTETVPLWQQAYAVMSPVPARASRRSATCP
jgi:hypothetical protein